MDLTCLLQVSSANCLRKIAPAAILGPDPDTQCSLQFCEPELRSSYRFKSEAGMQCRIYKCTAAKKRKAKITSGEFLQTAFPYLSLCSSCTSKQRTNAPIKKKAAWPNKSNSSFFSSGNRMRPFPALRIQFDFSIPKWASKQACLSVNIRFSQASSRSCLPFRRHACCLADEYYKYILIHEDSSRCSCISTGFRMRHRRSTSTR